MYSFTLEHTPAEIVTIFPKASDLFKANNINFCCQGDQTLHTVLQEKEMDESVLLEELNQRFNRWKDAGEERITWETMPLSAIVDYITEKYHHFLDEELSPLEQFVTRVFHVHGEDHPHLMELYDLYIDFKTGAEEHLIKEENELFPLIKEYDESPTHELATHIQETITGFEKAHENEIAVLKQIREVTDAFEPPAGACNTYRITYSRLAELEENTMQHVHVENNVLLKRLREIIAS